MNILMVTEDHSLMNFGVTTVVSQLCDELIEHFDDLKVVILSTSIDTVQQNEKIIIEKIPPDGLLKSWKGSIILFSRLKEIIAKYQIDIIHIHGVWMAAQWAGLLLAKQRRLPVIMSPHGMLLPWLWDGQGKSKQIKKRLYFSSFLRPVLPKHIIIHALTENEAKNFSRLFPGRTQVIIPNAISGETAKINRINLSIKKKFLFLGRIHPMKGVDILVRAFHQANLGGEWQLSLVGPPEIPEYLQSIEYEIEKLGLSTRVKIFGPVYGEGKDAFYESAWSLVSPSRAEGFGLVNLEAAKCGLPSILTTEAGLKNWESSGGLLVEPNVNELTNKLIEASRWSLGERIERGDRARIYVKEHYSWENVVQKWYDLYLNQVKRHI